MVCQTCRWEAAEGGGAHGRRLNHSSARRGWRRGREVRAVGEGVVVGWTYGVATTFLPRKGGAVPESEKRRAAWRITEPSHTCLCLLLCCPISSSLSRLGGAAGGRAVRCGVCVCATATEDRSQGTIGFVLFTGTQKNSRTRFRLLLRCPISSSLSRLGGAAGGRAVRRGV